MNLLRLLLPTLSLLMAAAATADTYITAARLVDTQAGRLRESPVVQVAGNRVVEVAVEMAGRLRFSEQREAFIRQLRPGARADRDRAPPKRS